MQITLAAVGKAKPGPELSLTQNYLKRLPWKVTVREVNAKSSLPVEARMAEEWRLLDEATASADRRIVLDERGKSMSTQQLADEIKKWQLQSAGSMAIIIGGADGLVEDARRKADVILSFGAMTWPHMLVRAMACEQLYRAWSVLSGHPYHRE